jgi:hypothetical protein
MQRDTDEVSEDAADDPPEAPERDPVPDDPLTRVMRRILRRGRAELGRAARSGRSQLERRQLQKDLDHFWVRLGKTAFRLVEAGEIDHPSLTQAMARIEELEGQLDGLRGPTQGDG